MWEYEFVYDAFKGCVHRTEPFRMKERLSDEQAIDMAETLRVKQKFGPLLEIVEKFERRIDIPSPFDKVIPALAEKLVRSHDEWSEKCRRESLNSHETWHGTVQLLVAKYTQAIREAIASVEQ